MIQFSIERPEDVQTTIHIGQKQRTINFDIQEAEQDGQSGFSFRSVTLPAGVWSYDDIVDALVSEVYPSGKMQAIQNNWIADPEDAEVQREMAQMQDWRRRAKEMAKNLIADI